LEEEIGVFLEGGSDASFRRERLDAFALHFVDALDEVFEERFDYGKEGAVA